MSMLITATTRFQDLPGRISLPLHNLGWHTPADILAYLHTHHPHVRMREDAENAIACRLIREPGWGRRTVGLFLEVLREQDVI